MEKIINKFEAYLLTEKRVSESTLGAYMRDIRQLFLYVKGEYNLTLKQITREHLKGFLFFLKKKKGSSARTMSRKISAIKVFYNYMNTYNGWRNISSDLTFPKLEKKLPQYLTEQEIQQLFEISEQDTSLIGERNRIMLYLLYVSGMRISEMVHLCVSHVQSDSGFINVSGKGGKGRVIPLPKFMMQKLDTYIETVLPKLICVKKSSGQNKARKNNITKNNYLFPVVYGQKIKTISRQAFWMILKKMWKNTGSKKSISPHQLRHSLATHMLKKGVDLRSLQMILGHENLSTVQIYTHLDISYLRDVYDKKHPRA